MPLLTATVSGLVFGIGLLLSGMADPLKVMAFLDLAGSWDPSLALVMVGAILTSSVGFFVARRRQRTWFEEPLRLPEGSNISRPLLVGSALFGIGWGLAGFCPGPALVGLGASYLPAGVFFIAMMVGMEGHAWYAEALARREAAGSVADS